MALNKIAGKENLYFDSATKVIQRQNQDGSYSDLEINGAVYFVQRYTDGSELVNSVKGVESLRFMQSSANGTAPTGDDEIYNSATGCKYFRVRLYEALAANQTVAIAWSTTSGNTAIDADAKSAADESIGVPTGAAKTNVLILDTNFKEAEIIWDGATTIKRIVAVSSDLNQISYRLNVVE